MENVESAEKNNFTDDKKEISPLIGLYIRKKIWTLYRAMPETLQKQARIEAIKALTGFVMKIALNKASEVMIAEKIAAEATTKDDDIEF